MNLRLDPLIFFNRSLRGFFPLLPLIFFWMFFLSCPLFAGLEWQELGEENYPGGKVFLKYHARHLKSEELGRRVIGVKAITITPTDKEWKDNQDRPLVYEYASLNDRIPFGTLELNIPFRLNLSNKPIPCLVETIFKTDIKGVPGSEKFEINRDSVYIHIGLDRSGGISSHNFSLFLLVIVVLMVMFQLNSWRNEKRF